MEQPIIFEHENPYLLDFKVRKIICEEAVIEVKGNIHSMYMVRELIFTSS